MAARAFAVLALVVAAVLVAVLLRGGGDTTAYKFRFQNAGQLVQGNEVKVGGRTIGTVDDIRLTDGNLAEIAVSIDEEFAPLRRGTRGTIRANSLSGQANRYLQITPGPNNAPPMRDGQVLEASETTSIVDLDQLFATFTPETRRGLQRFIRGSARQLQGRGREANQTAQYFNPALASTRRLVNEVNRDSRTLQRFLVDGARAMTALAERRETLTDLVSNANQAALGIANENEAFAETLDRLPGTLRRANSTFVNLRSTLTDLDVLVAESRPATRRLAPFLRELRPLVRDARPTIRDLRLAISRPGPGNDLLELNRQAPRLARVARPSLREATRALRQSTPVLDFIRPYTADFVGWFRDFGQTTANYDANGHYARIQPLFNLFSFTENGAGGLLTPQDPDNRLAGLEAGVINRCPGAATQPPPDGSAPFRDDGDLTCDQRLSLRGP
jgi:phospholipid/cholesterol/gamma-HCH transport system substrate-binding protein